VSRFRRERIYASVEHDRVALVRLDAANTAQEHAVIPWRLDPEHPEEAVQALAPALASPAWRGAGRRVVLSDRLARYLVLERPEGVRSLAELRLACEARFQASFDRPAAEWEIALDARPLARRFLACGVRKRLLQAMTSAFGAHGALLSLRPYLIAELARRAARLPAPCWFVTAARDCVTLAAVTEAGCAVVRVLAAEEPPSVQTIEQALARERLLAADVDGDAPVLVAGAIAGDLAASAMRRVDAPSWGTEGTGWSQNFRLALSEQWA
jgi:hypothetical protein